MESDFQYRAPYKMFFSPSNWNYRVAINTDGEDCSVRKFEEEESDFEFKHIKFQSLWSLHGSFLNFVICSSLQNQGLPYRSDGKESAYNAEDLGSIPGLGSSLEEGMATHSSVLACKIPMDEGSWQTTIRWVTKSQTQLSD